VLDVKTGSGAFMKRSRRGKSGGVARRNRQAHGKNVVALLTDMNQPLGRKAGNAMEVPRPIELLSGTGPADLRALCLELAAWMFSSW